MIDKLQYMLMIRDVVSHLPLEGKIAEWKRMQELLPGIIQECIESHLGVLSVFNWTAYKALWNWLSKNPGRKKYEWPGWEENGGRMEYVSIYCFACDDYDCPHCPLDWGGRDCLQPNSLFEQWFYYNKEDEEYFDEAKATELAILIRDLPLKEGVVCK